AMRLWLMDPVKPAMWHDERPGRWIAEAEWPSPAIEPAVLHLAGDRLAENPAPVSRLVASPADCGAQTGEYFPFVFGAELPGEQRVDDAKSVVFDHDGFDAVTDIVGAPKIHLRIVPQMPFGQIAVRLCDVDETGSSALITMGVLNLTHWKSHENPQPLVPGEAIDVVLDLDQIAYRLMPGRKLRLAVSNAYWPFVWPAPGKAPFTIEGGSIALPVRPTATGNEWHFEKPEGASPWNIAMRRKAHSSRRQETDMATGETTIIIENDFGITEDLDHGLWQEAVSVERWTIHPDDPLCASAHILWTKRMGRGDWQIEAKSSCAMRADAENFQIRANLSASENGQPVFERQYDDSIARDMV
ncbi:MAG: peptidase S15, partial [Nitratireductor sp.]|nr:peptidase S15 [Nitratireductor sp.]